MSPTANPPDQRTWRDTLGTSFLNYTEAALSTAQINPMGSRTKDGRSTQLSAPPAVSNQSTTPSLRAAVVFAVKTSLPGWFHAMEDTLRSNHIGPPPDVSSFMSRRRIAQPALAIRMIPGSNGTLTFTFDFEESFHMIHAPDCDPTSCVKENDQFSYGLMSLHATFEAQPAVGGEWDVREKTGARVRWDHVY